MPHCIDSSKLGQLQELEQNWLNKSLKKMNTNFFELSNQTQMLFFNWMRVKEKVFFFFFLKVPRKFVQSSPKAIYFLSTVEMEQRENFKCL